MLVQHGCAALGLPYQSRERHLHPLPLAAHARPTDVDLAALVAGGPSRCAPPVAGLVGTAFVDRAGKELRVLLEHPRDGRHPHRQAELLEAVANIGQIMIRLVLKIPRRRAVEGQTALPGMSPGARVCYVMP